MKECFKQYLKDIRCRSFALLLCFCMIVLVFFLYQIPWQTIAYCMEFAVAIAICSMGVEYIRYYRSYQGRQRLMKSVEYNIQEMPEAMNCMEEEYRACIRNLLQEKNEELSRRDETYRELKEYIMMWAHQIKTPITGLKLLLQQEESMMENKEDLKRLRRMREELFSIESYVGMNLEYIRLDSLNADLSVEECHLEKLVKQEVMHFSEMFIAKRLSIQMQNIDKIVISDAKWLSFVLNQILSNALKYTKKGGITIWAEEESEEIFLFIQDTGIGIAKEDLPRIFEKAFTGFNGHMDHKATGIGLYLSKQILDRLGHTIAITSTVGKGSCVKIGMPKKSEIIVLTKL